MLLRYCGVVLILLCSCNQTQNQEDIRSVDFQNFSYSKDLTLKNGKFIDHEEFGTKFNSIAYADFNNDGNNEAVVTLGTDVDGSAGYIEDYFIYTYHEGQAKEILHIQRENPQDEIQIVDKSLIITAPYWDKGDSHSAPSYIEKTTYGWKDDSIKVISKHLVHYDENAKDLSQAQPTGQDDVYSATASEAKDKSLINGFLNSKRYLSKNGECMMVSPKHITEEAIKQGMTVKGSYKGENSVIDYVLLTTYKDKKEIDVSKMYRNEDLCKSDVDKDWHSITIDGKCQHLTSPAEAMRSIQDLGFKPHIDEEKEDGELISVKVAYYPDGINGTVWTYYKGKNICEKALAERNYIPDEYR